MQEVPTFSLTTKLDPVTPGPSRTAERVLREAMKARLIVLGHPRAAMTMLQRGIHDYFAQHPIKPDESPKDPDESAVDPDGTA